MTEKKQSPNPPASKEPKPKLKTEPSEPGQGIKPGETKEAEVPGLGGAGEPGHDNVTETKTGSKE